MCLCVCVKPLVLMLLIHIIRYVVDRGALRGTNVAFTCSLQVKGRKARITPSPKRAHPHPPNTHTHHDRTCAMIKASSSCPLPVKNATSFSTSPVAMQYGIASSLSSAISCSALLQDQTTISSQCIYIYMYVLLLCNNQQTRSFCNNYRTWMCAISLFFSVLLSIF